MKIRKITTIKNYKSFSDFSWNKFCKNASGQEEILQNFSIVFGENGSGKSAICDVLKSVSQNQDFPNTPPSLAEVELNDGSSNQVHKYENRNWASQIGKNSFLFFDVDFVNANVHTHDVRSSNLQQGAHTQRAGKLIIDLDEQANNLKEAVKTKKDEVETLQNSCAGILEQQFTDKDKELFQTYKDADDKTKQEKLTKEQEELKKLEADLATLQKLNKKYAEINRISAVSQIVFSNPFSSKATFTELFTRQIKEKAQDEADEKIKTDFEIQDIYKLEEKTEHSGKFSDITTKEIDDLLTALESLKKIERAQVDAAKLYDAVIKKLQEIEKFVKGVNDLIVAKNKSVSNFKGKYSDQSKITSEIQEKTQKQTGLGELIDFLKSEKIKLIKNQNETIAKQKILSEELKKAQEDLKNYLANTIPESVISQMIAILGKFNLSFTLEHIKPAPNTKDYSFSFRIKDQKGNEREMKDGLSEGERQLISLAFFFAINEKLQNKDKTVLIFDDPITSLDSPNLKILAELIHKRTQEFSQVIVFTHHPLFFKYLAKCENPNPYKFGVLKNAEPFGGSFLFFDPGFDLTAEVQKCNQEISQNAQNGNLKPEEIALKYGQLLRLAVEKFIKNDLLMWDKEKRFDEVTESLKQGKNKMAKLSDGDFEVVTNMYKYCNYSNLLHADKETPSALSELMTHIDKFVKILDKVNT